MPESYVLRQDSAEAQRLNSQHQALLGAAGFLLHPRIVAALAGKQNLHVADVATGTGIWPLALEESVAAKDPQAAWSFTGLDLSAEKFPPTASSSSSKCKFATHDVRQPVPPHLREAFDVVHIRCLIGGLTAADWTSVPKHIFEMVKPGGWVQWQEMDIWSMRAYPGICSPLPSFSSSSSPPPPEVSDANVEANGVASTISADAGASDLPSATASEKLIEAFLDGFRDYQRYSPEDMPRFKSRVGAAGFQDLEVHRPSSDRVAETRQLGSMAFAQGMGEVLRYLSINGLVDGVSLEDADGMTREALAEIADGGVYWRFDVHVVTGRKS